MDKITFINSYDLTELNNSIANCKTKYICFNSDKNLFSNLEEVNDNRCFLIDCTPGKRTLEGKIFDVRFLKLFDLKFKLDLSFNFSVFVFITNAIDILNDTEVEVEEYAKQVDDCKLIRDTEQQVLALKYILSNVDDYKPTVSSMASILNAIKFMDKDYYGIEEFIIENQELFLNNIGLIYTTLGNVDAHIIMEVIYEYSNK